MDIREATSEIHGRALPKRNQTVEEFSTSIHNFVHSSPAYAASVEGLTRRSSLSVINVIAGRALYFPGYHMLEAEGVSSYQRT